MILVILVLDTKLMFVVFSSLMTSAIRNAVFASRHLRGCRMDYYFAFLGTTTKENSIDNTTS